MRAKKTSDAAAAVSDDELPRWIVSRIEGNKAKYVTTISAKDAESAVSLAVKQLSITDRELIKRLAARPG